MNNPIIPVAVDDGSGGIPSAGSAVQAGAVSSLPSQASEGKEADTSFRATIKAAIDDGQSDPGTGTSTIRTASKAQGDQPAGSKQRIQSAVHARAGFSLRANAGLSKGGGNRPAREAFQRSGGIEQESNAPIAGSSDAVKMNLAALSGSAMNRFTVAQSGQGAISNPEQESGTKTEQSRGVEENRLLTISDITSYLTHSHIDHLFQSSQSTGADSHFARPGINASTRRSEANASLKTAQPSEASGTIFEQPGLTNGVPVTTATFAENGQTIASAGKRTGFDRVAATSAEQQAVTKEQAATASQRERTFSSPAPMRDPQMGAGGQREGNATEISVGVGREATAAIPLAAANASDVAQGIDAGKRTLDLDPGLMANAVGTTGQHGVGSHDRHVGLKAGAAQENQSSEALVGAAVGDHGSLNTAGNVGHRASSDVLAIAMGTAADGAGAVSATSGPHARIEISGTTHATPRETAQGLSAPPANPGETFRALDRAQSVGQPVWTSAAGRHAEAGFQDPALGWIHVRADLGAGGVHASLVSPTSDAATILGDHLRGLSAHLGESHIPVASLNVETAGAGSGGSASGTGAFDNGNSHGNQPGSEGRQAGGEVPGMRKADSGISGSPDRAAEPERVLIAPYNSKSRHISVLA